jgi:hypothetical protein
MEQTPVIFPAQLNGPCCCFALAIAPCALRLLFTPCHFLLSSLKAVNHARNQVAGGWPLISSFLQNRLSVLQVLPEHLIG